jgi:hypothetical protein
MDFVDSSFLGGPQFCKESSIMRMIFLLMCLGFFGDVKSAAIDSLPKWNFYYNKQMILEGRAKDPAAKSAEVRLNEKKPGVIVITVDYDMKPTNRSTLIIRKGPEAIKTLQYSSNPSGSGSVPSVKSGSSFLIGVNEIVDFSEKKNVSLDFYYSDDRVSDVKFGTLRFIFAGK